MQKEGLVLPRTLCRADSNGPFVSMNVCLRYDQQCDHKPEENNAQGDCDPKQRFLDASSRCEHAPHIGAAETAQPRALALQDDACDKKH